MHDVSQLTFDDIRQRLAAHKPLRPDSTGCSEAAVAVVLAYGEEHGLDLLLIQRARKEGDPWSGQMGLPGGRREERDVDLLETARRETWEEIGIDLPPTLLGELDDLAPSTPALPPIIVRPYVFGLRHRPATRPSSEVAAIIWTPLRALESRQEESHVSVRGVQLTVPAYRIGPHVVWGMTHRILKPFIALVS